MTLPAQQVESDVTQSSLNLSPFLHTISDSNYSDLLDAVWASLDNETAAVDINATAIPSALASAATSTHDMHHTNTLPNQSDLLNFPSSAQFRYWPTQSSSHSLYGSLFSTPSNTTNPHGFFSNQFRPNTAMMHALNVLNGRLTVQDLENWLSPRARAAFTQTHSDALIYLIRDENLVPNDALIRVGSLSVEEIIRDILPSTSFSLEEL